MANPVVGIGDINAHVAKAMDVEKLNLDRLDKNKAILDYQLANYDNLKSLTKKFSDSVTHLASVFKTSIWKISSSDNAVVSTILTGKNVSPGNHQINITQLAQAHRISSAVFTDKSSALAMTGTLDIQLGSNTFSLNMNPDDTLEDIRDNINNSINNPGVNASILATTSSLGTQEYRLILASKDTGLSNQISVTGTGAGSLDVTHELNAAQNAQFTFDGFDVSRSSNTVSDLLEGVTFTLNADNASATLSISADSENKNETIKSAINTIVDYYNAIIESIDKNQATKTTRDSTYSLIKLRLENTMGQAFGNSSIQKLLDIGIKKAPSEKRTSDDVDPSTNKNVEYYTIGKMTIDVDELSTAINNNYDVLNNFFTDKTVGFIKSMDNVINELTREGGNISAREKSITKNESVLSKRIDKEEARLDALENFLYIKFSTLNTFVQKYQHLGNFLEQQISALTYIYKK